MSRGESHCHFIFHVFQWILSFLGKIKTNVFNSNLRAVGHDIFGPVVSQQWWGINLSVPSITLLHTQWSQASSTSTDATILLLKSVGHSLTCLKGKSTLKSSHSLKNLTTNGFQGVLIMLGSTPKSIWLGVLNGVYCLLALVLHLSDPVLNPLELHAKGTALSWKMTAMLGVTAEWLTRGKRKMSPKHVLEVKKQQNLLMSFSVLLLSCGRLTMTVGREKKNRALWCQ